MPRNEDDLIETCTGCAKVHAHRDYDILQYVIYDDKHGFYYCENCLPKDSFQCERCENHYFFTYQNIHKVDREHICTDCYTGMIDNAYEEFER